MPVSPSTMPHRRSPDNPESSTTASSSGSPCSDFTGWRHSSATCTAVLLPRGQRVPGQPRASRAILHHARCMPRDRPYLLERGSETSWRVSDPVRSPTPWRVAPPERSAQSLPSSSWLHCLPTTTLTRADRGRSVSAGRKTFMGQLRNASSTVAPHASSTWAVESVASLPLSMVASVGLAWTIRRVSCVTAITDPLCARIRWRYHCETSQSTRSCCCGCCTTSRIRPPQSRRRSGYFNRMDCSLPAPRAAATIRNSCRGLPGYELRC